MQRLERVRRAIFSPVMRIWTPRSRFLGALGFCSVALLSFAVACTDDDGGPYGNGGSGDPCNQFATCGTCTPQNGCGWCSASNGQGLCASDPDECAGASSFDWTWNPSGCLVPVDAGTITVGTPTPDAGSPTPTDAAGATPPGTSPDAASSQGVPDAATSDAAASDASDAASTSPLEASTSDGS
jgi:hypothetical protein